MKKLCLIGSCLLVCLLLCGCSNAFAKREYGNETALTKEEDHYVKTASVLNAGNNGTSFTCGSFDGRQTVWKAVKKDAEDVQMQISLKMKEGNAKLICINEDGVITTLCEEEKNTSFLATITLMPGNNWIKFVGYDCKNVNLEMTIV